MNGAREVVFFQISSGRSVLTEIAELLTEVQLARFVRNVERLEKYGWDLDGDYFGLVQGVRAKLHEYRLTLDRVEFRVLFAQEGRKFVMLAAYKEKRGSIPEGARRRAIQRLKQWRESR